MKTIFVIVMLSYTLFSMEDPKTVLAPILEYAIKIGHGNNRVYAFIDPLCSKSRAYVELISTDQKLQQRNTYYLFLYRLEKFDSQELIEYIYQSNDPKNELIKVISNEVPPNLFEFEPTSETEKLAEAVSRAGRSLQIKKRPYLLIYQEGSAYCKVSEGTAPCLEK